MKILMKRLIPLFLVLCLMLCACSGTPEETVPSTAEPTQVPTTEAATVPPTTVPPTTEAPTEPPVLYTNPLTGEALDEPYTGRIFAVTISNVPQALPHYGVSQADMYFEMLVNGGAIRGLALYTDPSEVTAIGSVRSARLNFVDVCPAYDAERVSSGGSNYVRNNIWNAGIPNLNESGYACFFRDYTRYNSGYAWEHCLFIDGSQLVAAAESENYRTTQLEDKDYCLNFAEEVALDGETADEIRFNYWSNDIKMNYDAETQRYNYSVFGGESIDGTTGEVESFKNVILLLVDVYQDGEYHVSDIQGSGEGYFACNGKIVPIQWTREYEDDAFTYTLADGTPLELAVGNTYVGFVPDDDDCDISWE